MLKKLLWMRKSLLAASASALVLAGCASQAPSPAEQVVITIAHPLADGVDVWLESIIAEPITDKYPNIKIRFSRNKNLVDSYPPNERALETWTSDNPPDLVLIDRTAAAGLASHDYIRNLSLDMDKAGIAPGDYYAAAWEECTYEGNSYCLPLNIDTEMLYYNKTLMKDAGLNPEAPITTLAELDRAADLITKKDNNAGYQRIGFLPWLNANLNTLGLLYGGRWQEQGRFTPNHAKNIEALEWIVKEHNSLERGPLNQFLEQKKSSFFDGKTGFAILSSEWNTINNAAFEWGVAPLPTLDGKPAVQSGSGFGIAIAKNSKHPEEAWQVLEFLAYGKGNEIVTKEISKNGGIFISARPEINQDARLSRNKKVAPFLEILPNLVPRPKNANDIHINNELTMTMYKAIGGEGSPALLLEELSKRSSKQQTDK